MTREYQAGWNSEDVLIVSIDPGTTSFKSACATTTESWENDETPVIQKNSGANIIMLSNFPGYRKHEMAEVPNWLIYDRLFHLSKWGHLATNFMSKDSFDPNYLVRYWKFAVHDSSDPISVVIKQQLRQMAKRLGKRPEDFIKDFFCAWRSYLFDEPESVLLRSHVGELSQYKYIDIVISVPPGWPRQEHQLFTSAAKSGIGLRAGWRVYTVSETECVLRAWMFDLGDKLERLLKVGVILVLLDIGGGTACIAVYHYEGGRKWAHMESHSPTAGSEIVTEEFLKDLQKRIKFLNLSPSKESKLIYKARTLFNEHKMDVGSEEEEDWCIEVEGVPFDSEKDFTEGKIWVKRDRMRGYFQTSHNMILQKLDEVTTRIAHEHEIPKASNFLDARGRVTNVFQYLLLAGAASRNELFRRRLRKANKFKMEMHEPLGVKGAVARGACLSRIEGDFRQFAKSPKSIGILTYELWTEARKINPKAHKRQFDGDKKLYSPVIEWVLKLNDAVMPNMLLAPDGKNFRERYFEAEEEAKFTDQLILSDGHPGADKWTVLEYSSASEWEANEEQLRKIGLPMTVVDLPWDLSKTNGSFGPFDRSALLFHHGNKKHFLKYRYFLHWLQVESRISLEAYFTQDRHEEMEIATINMGEQESVALQEEYNNLRPRSMGSMEARDSQESSTSLAVGEEADQSINFDDFLPAAEGDSNDPDTPQIQTQLSSTPASRMTGQRATLSSVRRMGTAARKASLALTQFENPNYSESECSEFGETITPLKKPRTSLRDPVVRAKKSAGKRMPSRGTPA